MVDGDRFLDHGHELCVKWCSKHDFPVPASPIGRDIVGGCSRVMKGECLANDNIFHEEI